MKIALFMSTDTFEDFFGGGLGLTEADYISTYRNDFSFEYAKMLSEVGIGTVIYNFTRHGESRGAKHSLVDCFVKFVPTTSWYKLYRSIPYSGKTFLGRYISSYISTNERQLEQEFRKEGIDIVYVQEYAYGRFDAIAKVAKRMGIPVVGAHHGSSIHKGLLERKRRSLKLADLITCLNYDELNKMKACYPELADKIKLVPNAVNTSLFKIKDREESARNLGLDPRKTYLLTVGRLFDTQKGHTTLIKAMSLMEAGPQTELLIIGTGPDRELLQKQIDQLGLGQKVTLVGQVLDRSKMSDYFNLCEMFVLPSRYEGMPLVILEAGACGKPTVAFDVVGVRDLLNNGENGVKIPVHSAELLAKEISSLLADGLRRKAMGAKAHELVQREYNELSLAKKFKREFELMLPASSYAAN
jgi:glycosyltransferase involved in cell wall biosynthesis